MKDHKQARSTIRTWVSGRLSEEVRRMLDRLSRSDDVQRIAVMPDVHLAHDVCVGTVFATSELIYPDAVGGDIGCGMAAVALDASIADLDDPSRPAEFLRGLRSGIPIQRHRADAKREVLDRLPEPAHLSTSALRKRATRDGVMQLGTLGTGNHFLELQHDDDGQLWLMVHSGSRGMGQAIRAAHILNARQSSNGLKYLSSSSSVGQTYLGDMEWARQYAAVSRRCMLLAAGRIARTLFGWTLLEETLFDCDHNHISRERHFELDLLIHRKGAMPAFRNMPGIVPGSMASASFHVLGRGVPDAMCSSAHGAGRAMSRAEARRRITHRSLQHELSSVHVDPRMLSGLREEAPSAYKDIRAVMRAQRKLVRIVRTLTPVLSHKGVSPNASQ